MKLNTGLSDEQRDARRNYIGGSDAGIIAGVSPFGSAFELYLEKIGERPDRDTTENMVWGNFLEPIIAQRYADLKNVKIRKQSACVSRQWPFAAVNVDRRIVGHPNGPGVLEVKNYGPWSGVDGTWTELPDHVYLQIQHAMAVTGDKWGALAILVGGNKFYSWEVERNDGVIADLMEMEADFWRRIEQRRPPAPDGSDAATAAIKRRYPKDAGIVETWDDADAVAWGTALLAARVAFEKAELQKKTVENQIKARMGEVTTVTIPDVTVINWKNNKDSDVTDWEKAFYALAQMTYGFAEHPNVKQAIADNTRKKPGGRVFTVKPITPAAGQ